MDFPTPTPAALWLVRHGESEGNVANEAARRAHALTRPVLVPRFRVSWTHTTLAAVSGSRRANSVVIVISATRNS